MSEHEHEEPGEGTAPQDDPRGGEQSDEYRHADPRTIVEEGGTAMTGPGGTPQENLSIEERKELSRALGTDPRSHELDDES